MNKTTNKQNKTRGMETLNRLTVVRGEKRDGDCLKEVKGLVKEHIQRTHGYGQWE